MPRKNKRSATIGTRPAALTQSGNGNKNNQLRIIAGSWRGRKLPVADLPGLRPTSDRIRETVFNWLNMYVPGAHVLDCFSGSGALSLEALSRGAESAVLLEKAAPAAHILKQNLKTLKADHGKVVNTNSLEWLNRPADKALDIIFLDPPFRTELLEQTCMLLENNGYLHDNSLIYIEVEKELSPLPVPAHWQPLKSKTGGQVHFSLWTRSTTE